MADATTTAKAATKSDLQEENDRLRALLEANNINPGGRPAGEGIVGNIADVQRFFGKVATEGSANVADEVVVPATVDVDTGRTSPAQTAAEAPAAADD